MDKPIQFTCIVCEAVSTDSTGWQLSVVTDQKRGLRFGVCPDPVCRSESAPQRRIWEGGPDASATGLTKQEMMQRLRAARRKAGCCIYCGQPKPKQPAIGRRRTAERVG